MIHANESYFSHQKKLCCEKSKKKTFVFVNLWHVKPLSVLHVTKEEGNSREKDTNNQTIESDTRFVSTKRFPCVIVSLYSLFSIHIGVFIGHFGHTTIKSTIDPHLLLKPNPMKTKIHSGWTVMVQIYCRNERYFILQSIDIDFCPLIQLINQSNHIE